MSQAKSHMIASARCRSRKQKGDEETDRRRAPGGEEKLSGQKYEGAGGEADNDGADWSDSTLMRIHANRKADEKWQRMDRKRKQGPADDGYSDNIEKDANDDHGDGSRDDCCKGYASTTTTARLLI